MEMEALVEVALEAGIYIMSDEIPDIARRRVEHHSPASFSQAADKVITVAGFSKTFSILGGD